MTSFPSPRTAALLARATAPTNVELARWLSAIAGDGLQWPLQDAGAELARWVLAAVPATHHDAVGDIWRSMLGLDARPAGVVRLDRPLSVDEASRVLRSVRCRARRIVRNQRWGRWRHEVPAGDLRDTAA